jgi:hypothetical protein
MRVCCLCHPPAQGGYCVVTTQRLLWIDASATPAAGRSCAVPLGGIQGVHKRVQYGLNVMKPKVRLEVKVLVDHTLRVAASECAAGSGRACGLGHAHQQLRTHTHTHARWAAPAHTWAS